VSMGSTCEVQGMTWPHNYNQRCMPAPMFALGDKVFLCCFPHCMTRPLEEAIELFSRSLPNCSSVDHTLSACDSHRSMFAHVHLVFHVVQLMPVTQRSDRMTSRPPPAPNGVLEANNIMRWIYLDIRLRLGSEFLVNWKGYGYRDSVGERT